MALEEALSDHKEIGRPLTLTVHEKKSQSLLSKLFHESTDLQGSGSGQRVQLKGMINLLVLLLMVTNIRTFLTSIQKRGFTLREHTQRFIESEWYLEKAQWRTIVGIFNLAFFAMLSFVLELIASFDKVNRHLLLALIVINQIVVLIYPLAISFTFRGNIVLCNSLMLLATSMCLKLVSFHHTMHDVRHLCKKVAKLK